MTCWWNSRLDGDDDSGYRRVEGGADDSERIAESWGTDNPECINESVGVPMIRSEYRPLEATVAHRGSRRVAPAAR